MKLEDIFQETYESLSGNKIRSSLTMLGIIIGISSVIALVAVGAGAQASIQSSIQSLGSNLLQVMPGATRTLGFGASAGRGSANSLTLEDAKALSPITGVSAVAPSTSGRYQITARGTNTNTSVSGVTAGYLTVRNIAVDQGSFISDQNNVSTSKVAVLGPTTMTDLFGADAAADQVIGQTIRIKGFEFKVIGVTVSKGGSGFTNQDDIIYVPVTTAQQYLTGDRYVSTISVQASSADVMTQVQNDLTSLLLTRHNISDLQQADFNVVNQADIIGAASSVTGTLTALLAAVAGISLVVGGIGIMNMMLTTVTERTREIGLRKAIGAKRRDISLQFLVESVALTFIGGFFGIVLGWLIAYALSAFGIIQASVTLSSVLLAFGVSAGIGIIFGYYPATRAAKLNPIEALRYE